MGVDIHLCIERRDPGGPWTAVSGETHQIPRWLRVYEPHGCAFGYDRDYPLFAVLAGVRNEYGYVPISYPRGLPSDLSAPVAEEYRARGDAELCPSWHSLSVLKSYDWTKFLDRPWRGSFEWPETVISFLETLGAPDDVRIVFSFSC